MASSPATVFAEHAARGELAYQAAPDGSAVFPPRLVEPGTGAELTWKVSAGMGTVYAATVLRKRDAQPRSLVLVDLDEGFRMMSRVDGVEADAVAIGQRVQVRFDGETPVFGPC